MSIEKRSAGIFLHPTSLPSPYGIGDFGDDAYRWLDVCERYGQRFWQVCPLSPTGYGDSPYQCLSSFAGSRLMISPQKLFEKGLVTRAHLDEFPRLSDAKVDFTAVYAHKDRLFEHAHTRFTAGKEYNSFCEAQAGWLDEFAMFMVLKEMNNGLPWYEWEQKAKCRDKATLDSIRKARAKRIDYYKFLQFVFRSQWNDLRKDAARRGIKIIGDVPYYVAYDSCDCWASPEVFEFDADGSRLRVGGVPPDYFSADGQLWGNPLYRWDVMKANGFEWWMKRFEKTLELVDIIRLDHFRGFESFWAVKAGSPTAKTGEWETAPGAGLFDAVKKRFGALPFIAEDLGHITDKVRRLLSRTGLPGMKVLQFAFDNNALNPYLPYNTGENSVVYTGTHDNNTSIGWYRSLPEDARARIRLYMACGDDAFLDYFLRLAYSARPRLCIVPLQDIMGLDATHRFNTPGTGEGNWDWRFSWNMLEGWMLERMARYTALYGRGGEKNV